MPRPWTSCLPSQKTVTTLTVAWGAFFFLDGNLACAEDAAKSAENCVQWAWPTQDVARLGTGFWPQFLGPTGNGQADPSAKPPSQWSESTNIAWKTPIAGQGWSSPIVWGDRVFVTTATVDGKVMSAVALDRHNGKVLWDRVVFTNETVQPDHHATNSYASPTPVADADHLYVHFGAYGTAALKAGSGETVWERRDLPCNHFRGPGSSPILYGDRLIFAMDGFDFKYMVALDKRTGRTDWKRDRQIEYGTDDGDIHKAYSTPTLAKVQGRVLLVCSSSKASQAFLPATGEEVWRVRYDEYSTTGRALFDGERFFVNTGFAKAKLMAVRPDGTGDVTASHVDWVIPRGIGNKPSQIVVGPLIFSVDDRGVFTNFRKSDGSQIEQTRVGGDFSATPLLADGKIYLFDHEGAGYVFSADESLKKLAENRLEGGCRASPLAVGQDLIVRTTSHLYCLRSQD